MPELGVVGWLVVALVVALAVGIAVLYFRFGFFRRRRDRNLRALLGHHRGR